MVTYLDIAESDMLDLDDGKSMLVARAHESAKSLDKDIALCLLGSRKTYVKRLCEEYRAVTDDPCDDILRIYNSVPFWIITDTYIGGLLIFGGIIFAFVLGFVLGVVLQSAG